MLTADAFSDVVAGRIVFPEDEDWDAARRTFNLALDQRPVAVAFPSGERDVALLVRMARDRELRIAPQAAGHNAAPLGSLDDTMVVNTSALTGVQIDAATKRVRVGGGAKWEAVTARLSAAGLAALHGSSPDVGIAGYSLGGGMGWLARKHGLQTNSVTALEIVTADGRLMRVDADHEPDLFWALRGGGGNFGVVTAVEFAVYPLDQLYAGVMLFGFEHAAEVLHAWTSLLPAAPDELMSWAALLHLPDLPFVPEPLRGGSFAAVWGAFLGDDATGRSLFSQVRGLGPVMDTFAMVHPIGLAELAMDPPVPLPYLTAHQLLDELPSSAVDALVAAAGPASQLGMLQFRHMGGALARRPPEAGVRATLPGEICMFALGITPDEKAAADVQRALTTVEQILAPNQVGLYPNFVEEPADASEFFDAMTWARLRQIKAEYDPDDLFKGNHHLPPAD
jgi:FAD/FMN-containing dehydrogenase